MATPRRKHVRAKFVLENPPPMEDSPWYKLGRAIGEAETHRRELERRDEQNRTLTMMLLQLGQRYVEAAFEKPASTLECRASIGHGCPVRTCKAPTGVLCPHLYRDAKPAD